MLCKLKKEEDVFGVDGLGGKVICYLEGNFKLGVYLVGKYGCRIRGNINIYFRFNLCGRGWFL